jgi:5-methylcytosine-specific restriction enzyme subunit McrC
MDVIGQWMAHALNLNVVPKCATTSGKGPMIAQLIDRIWSAAVADASRHGGPRVRRAVVSESRHVRGRLDVRGTVKLRAAGKPLVSMVRSERNLENPVSRIVVLADRTLCSLVGKRPDWRPDRCEETLSHLRQSVGSAPKLPHESELRRVHYSPITRPYQSLASLSMEIARKRGHLVSAESDDVSGVLIDVAELWELFLVHCARLAFGASRVEHGTNEGESTFLLSSTTKPGATMGRLKPDMLIRDETGALSAVVDAKYKRLRGWQGSPHGVDRGDLYQLTSYLAGHPKVTVGALAYPENSGDVAPADRNGPWRTVLGQKVIFGRFSPRIENAAATLSCLGLAGEKLG